jgi:hypothetical protein
MGFVDDDYLALDDDTLLAQCEVDTFRASGPGGQHRNKTDSGVRLRHRPTGLTAQGVERRSQHENRATALKRLRARIAMEHRRPVELDAYSPPPELVRLLPATPDRIKSRHPDFWRGAQHLLDLFVATGCSLSSTAGYLGISTGQLSRLMASEPELLRKVNALRQQQGLRPVRG